MSFSTFDIPAWFPKFMFFCFISQPQMSPVARFGVRMHETSLSTPSRKWQRVLLKVSGEALAGDHTQNIDPKVMNVIDYFR